MQFALLSYTVSVLLTKFGFVFLFFILTVLLI